MMCFLPAMNHDDADEHADAGGQERVAPPVIEAQVGGDEVAGEGADVDAHVEDVVAGVLLLAVARVVVEVADQRRDVRLEEAVAEDDEQQRDPEVGAVAGDRQAAVAEAHQDAADDDRAAVAEDAVGEQAADERREIDEREVGAEDVLGGALRHVEAALGGDHRVGASLHVEHEDAEDQIEAEALPHLGEEQDGETLRMVLEHRRSHDTADASARENFCRGPGSTSDVAGSRLGVDADVEGPDAAQDVGVLGGAGPVLDQRRHLLVELLVHDAGPAEPLEVGVTS
jgi:hypothetical protein